MHVVHGQEVGSRGFFGGDMVNESSSDAEAALRWGTAAGALTAFFDRPEVFGVGGFAEV